MATLFLICVGGMVTSHGVGMAVPDWPNTYGYNMFFFPISQWIGGIFYEHTHRLVASAVGLLTMILTFWLYGRKSRPWLKWGGLPVLLVGILVCVKYPNKWQDGVFMALVGAVAFGASFRWPNFDPAAKWMRRLGLVALIAVIFQGVLGGLRVTEMKDEIGIFHATLAQLFFVLIGAIALFQTRFWQGLNNSPDSKPDRLSLRYLFLGATVLILLQLIIAATMRHQHAGLAIPDFPKAYGTWWPDMSESAVLKYNQTRMETTGYKEITAFQIGLQMIHRVVAALILIAVSLCAWLTKREFRWQNPLSRISLTWMFLILVQVFLGAATIWTGKSADVATAHVAVGALSLVMGAMLTLVSFRLLKPVMGTCESGDSPMVQPLPTK